MLNNSNTHNTNNTSSSYEGYSLPTISINNDYASLRKNKEVKFKNAPAISHATRIEPTNLSYKDLLRKHQFTPSIRDQKECEEEEAKCTNDIDYTANLNQHKNSHKLSRLDIQRETFRSKAIIEEPKKSISGYQLFAKWKRAEKPGRINTDYPQSKALSIAWNDLDPNGKDEWATKAEQAKQQYIDQKQIWLKYVHEAKRLGIPIPTKSVKPIIQPIKIKNLLNLIPNVSKFNKETQFIISKATEMFIQFYASKAIEISNKVSNTEATVIAGKHCYDALQTEHKFNFLRAVTVKPFIENKKRRNPCTQMEDNDNEKQKKKKRKITTTTKTNQIITNHDDFTAYPATAYPGYQYPYHQYPIYQQYPHYPVPPNPFHNVNVEKIQSPNTQILNVQQIFGNDE